MKLLTSIEAGRADELLVWLKQEQIPCEVRSIRQPNGLEASEVLVEDRSFDRGLIILEEWYAEQKRSRKNEFWMWFIVALFILCLVLMLFKSKLGAFGLILIFEWAFSYAAWKAVRSGVINSRPLADWTPEIERSENPYGFWWRVFLCILMAAFLLGFFIYGVTRP